jgi:F-type H+-transporting ATPase subunit delta
MNSTHDQPQSGNGASAAARVADVGSRRIARVYAESFLDAAAKQGQEEGAFEELQALVRDIFRQRADFEEFLNNLAIGRKAKANAIRKTFADRASPLLLNFLLILNDHDRLKLLAAILRQCQDLREVRQGLMHVLIKSAVPLPDDQRERLAGEVRQLFGKEPVVETQVDPSMLGGLIVRVGDWLYDASVRTRLLSIRHELFESATHAIEKRRDQFGAG